MAASTDDLLRALADGTRRDILRLVWTHERPAGQIATRFAVTRQAVSQHLGVLLGCGLVSVRAEGTKRLYRANHRPLEQLRAEFDLFSAPASVSRTPRRERCSNGTSSARSSLAIDRATPAGSWTTAPPRARSATSPPRTQNAAAAQLHIRPLAARLPAAAPNGAWLAHDPRRGTGHHSRPPGSAPSHATPV